MMFFILFFVIKRKMQKTPSMPLGAFLVFAICSESYRPVADSIKPRNDTDNWVRRLVLCLSSCLEASAAVNRTVGRRLEGDLSFAAAVCANSSEVLAGSLACVLLSVTACLASLGLVQKALFVVESLFACGEYEFIAAIFANQRFVNVFFFYYYCIVDFFLEHVCNPLFVVKMVYFYPRRIFTAIFGVCSNALFKLFGH